MSISVANEKPLKSLLQLLVIFSFACLLSSCGQQTATPTLFTPVENSGINFRNDVKEATEDNGFLFRNFYNGGGVATGDINNDGLPDVMFTSNQGENKLYLNKGNFSFEDISAKAGLKQDSLWNTGVTFVDVNADGWLDIYVCASGHIQTGHRKNKLYINQHNNTFQEEAAQYGLDISGYCTQAVFFDYDGDGDLDCFIINNSPVPFSSLNYANMRDVDITKWQVDEKLKGGGNHLYQNKNGRFVEVSKEAGLHTGLISFGLGVAVGDVNADGWPDIYVGNDFIEKDYLYINQKNGTFKDELEACMQKISMSSMSADLGDINNDGRPDVFTTDMIPDDDYRLKTTGTFDNIDLYLSKQKAGLYHQYVRNCLQVNNGDGSFSEMANYAGVFGTDWSWGALFFDADNDGLNDIFVCNGIAKDVGDLDFLDFFSADVYQKTQETGERLSMDELLKHIPSTPLPNRTFRNAGNFQFQDRSKDWGFAQPSFSNSVAYADLDGDGDLDLIVNNENAAASVYRNNECQQEKNHFIQLQLQGSGSNPFAVGSIVKAYKGEQVFYREVVPVRGFQSSMEYKQTIGLGALTSLDSLVVIWPDRIASKYVGLRLDTLHRLQHPGNAAPTSFSAVASPAYFERTTDSFVPHREDDYVDFYYERNLPEMLSREGPHLAVGDVDGDGLQDVYLGGGKGQGGQLYLQTREGGWLRKEEPIFQQYRDFEDVAVLLFDADRDGDLDLFLGAGGNNVPPGERALEHRLYKNDGHGNFALDAQAFSANSMNIATAAAYDYDADGDEDLFVGSRSTPRSYGQVPQSYLYENDGQGHFKDVTPPSLAHVGMVTAAAWADVDGDSHKELIVTGEWMETKIYRVGKNRVEEIKATGLGNRFGWWQSLAVADVNGDGRQDLVIGNIGENFYLRPTEKAPVKLWVQDFDGNGAVEPFLTRSISGRDVPVFLKREVTEQFPALKKENLRHQDYATKSIQDLFGDKLLAKANLYLFNFCSSIVAINNGGGRFTVQRLPVRGQLSSMNAICPADVNGDGKIDLITGGNLFTFPPQFGRLDASYGDVFINNGKGEFTWLSNLASGLYLRGQTKDIKEIKAGQSRRFLFAQNNEVPVLYQLKSRK